MQHKEWTLEWLTALLTFLSATWLVGPLLLGTTLLEEEQPAAQQASKEGSQPRHNLYRAAAERP